MNDFLEENTRVFHVYRPPYPIDKWFHLDHQSIILPAHQKHQQNEMHFIEQT